MEGFWKDSTVIAPVAGYAVNTNVAQAPITQMISSNKAQLVASVTELGKWATMSKWATAAEVWAWVQPSVVGGGNQWTVLSGKQESKMSCNAFTKLGVKGLKDDSVVKSYWSMWQFAIEQGWAKPSVIGQLAVLPVKDWDEAKDLLTNGPASVKVPAASKADQTWAFTWKPGDGVTIDETNVAELTKLYLTLKVEFDKLANIEFVVENKVTAKKLPGFAQAPCAECGTPADMITVTSKAPAGVPAGAGWMSAETGHKDGCTQALPKVH